MKCRIYKTSDEETCPDELANIIPDKVDNYGRPYFEIDIVSLDDLLALLKRHIGEYSDHKGYTTFHGGLLLLPDNATGEIEIEIYDNWRE